MFLSKAQFLILDPSSYSFVIKSSRRLMLKLLKLQTCTIFIFFVDTNDKRRIETREAWGCIGFANKVAKPNCMNADGLLF